MTTITISRQMGSLGHEVADKVADLMGYRVVWREVINMAASRSRAPVVALATIDELDLLGLRPSKKEIRAYLEAVREIMIEMADSGNIVIVGRAGQAILHGRCDVLHVRLYAPLDLRIERIAERHSVSPEMARAQVQISDQTREQYLKRNYQVRWDDPEYYDLMMNTGCFTPQAAAEIISEAARRK